MVLAITTIVTDVGLSSAGITGSTVKETTDPATALSILTIGFIILTLLFLTTQLIKFVKI